MLAYPARFLPEDDGIVVEFPDLPGCLTEASDWDSALSNAEEALSGWLISVFHRAIELPPPSSLQGEDVRLIRPFPEVELAYELRRHRRECGRSQEQLAKQLGISYQAYQKLENPGTCNATLKTLRKVSRALGKRLDIQLV
ncbi:MAG: type II toxin-antitoxin system HicB family antitoxin [Armatimonadetes bacterium]|nr:type II toxin-antitoxin system HicB family antitoxin [Armatimonadota bacterium]